MKPSSHILSFVEKTLKNSRVYKRFLKQQNALGVTDFSLLPVSSKEEYIQNLAYSDVIEGGQTPEVIYASSGSSGKPTFWFRDESSVDAGERLHRFIFKHIFQIKKDEPTLIIVTFGMGLWVAGLFTADACRALRKSGYSVTVATPGIDKEEGLIVLKQAAAAYTHVVIAGYPPFVLDFLREAHVVEKGVHPSVFVLNAGDKFSEGWRDEALSLIGQEGEHDRIVGLYGSADAGAMAFETPHTIAKRRAAEKDQNLREELFGKEGIGGLYQFLPEEIHIEEVGEELAITKPTTVPLIRYNIHDKGFVFKPIGKGTYEALPMVSICGRTDVAVTLYALNIYPEHIRAGLSHESCTGSYRAYTKTREGVHSEQLVVEVELLDGIQNESKLKEEIENNLVSGLKENSSEYRKLTNEIGESAKPEVVLKEKGELVGSHIEERALLQIAGKKPKMVI